MARGKKTFSSLSSGSRSATESLTTEYRAGGYLSVPYLAGVGLQRLTVEPRCLCRVPFSSLSSGSRSATVGDLLGVGFGRQPFSSLSSGSRSATSHFP